MREITSALLLIFNAGIIMRTIQEFLSAKEDENGPSISKIIIKNVKIMILINLIGALVVILKGYYGY